MNDKKQMITMLKTDPFIKMNLGQMHSVDNTVENFGHPEQ
jgi:hypothetical protein